MVCAVTPDHATVEDQGVRLSGPCAPRRPCLDQGGAVMAKLATSPAVQNELRPHDVVADVPCVHCGAAIRSAAFDFTSATRRFLSATCPSCARAVTLPTTVWR